MKFLRFLDNAVQENVLFRLYRFYVIDSILIVRRSGFRELLRQRGWKVVLVIVGYYLVRDTLVYVVLPYLVARGIM